MGLMLGLVHCLSDKLLCFSPWRTDLFFFHLLHGAALSRAKTCRLSDCASHCTRSNSRFLPLDHTSWCASLVGDGTSEDGGWAVRLDASVLGLRISGSQVTGSLSPLPGEGGSASGRA